MSHFISLCISQTKATGTVPTVVSNNAECSYFLHGIGSPHLSPLLNMATIINPSKLDFFFGHHSATDSLDSLDLAARFANLF